MLESRSQVICYGGFKTEKDQNLENEGKLCYIAREKPVLLGGEPSEGREFRRKKRGVVRLTILLERKNPEVLNITGKKPKEGNLTGKNRLRGRMSLSGR